jgi:two-component system nitrate/nitrite response regulator NarL
MAPGASPDPAAPAQLGAIVRVCGSALSLVAFLAAGLLLWRDRVPRGLECLDVMSGCDNAERAQPAEGDYGPELDVDPRSMTGDAEAVPDRAVLPVFLTAESRVIRIVVADRHPLFLDGVEHALEREPDLRVVARCANGVEVLTAVQKHDPDVLVLDIAMREKDGLTVLRELRQQERRTRVVLLTAGLRDDEVVEAHRLGVRGVILKEMPSHSLVQCLRRVHAGGHWVEKTSLPRAMDVLLRGEAATRELNRVLTPRETEVVRKTVRGLGNRAIAEELGVSEGTIKIHLHNIYEKLHLNGRFSLMVWAREHGLI